MIGLFGLVVFLFAFASGRNAARLVADPVIKFTGENNLFVTNETVSKLLIQNYGGGKNVAKETLDLNRLENALKSNPMIKSAEVYVTINGTINAEIKQKTPVARVSTDEFYYIDDRGFYMPLSSNYSARVPLVTGAIDKSNLNNIFRIASKIRDDPFLKTNVIEIHQSEDRMLYLKMRQYKFLVQLGDLKAVDKKINNLKAFYQKNIKERTLNNYSKVNLQFGNQVVCTKI